MRAFRDAWLDGDTVATALLVRRFDHAPARADAVAAALARPVDAAVADELLAQNPPVPGNAALDAARATVAAGRFAVVVTGQQVGLLGGPLYAAHKAASAVALAARLERETGVPVLPIFWLQTEDHDAEEIASTVLLDVRGAAHRVAAEIVRPHARTSLAHATLEGLGPVRERATAALSSLPHGEQVASLAAEVLGGRDHPADAFVRTLRRLFAGTPLLFFSPRTSRIAALAAPLHRHAIEQSEAIDRLLVSTADLLTEAGLPVQVPVREGSALSFVHVPAAIGGRLRPQRDASGSWRLGDEALSTAELLGLLESDPLRFSTSALLRPLVQDALLPTAAWIGGPAELAYYAQIGLLYDLFGVRQPLVFARRHVRWLPPPVRDAAAMLGIAPASLTEPIDQLAARLPRLERLGPTPDEVEARLTAAIDTALGDLEDELAWSPDLGVALGRTRDACETAARRLAERVARARLAADHERVEPLRAARRWLEVDGTPQERVINALSIAVWIGIDAFRDALLAVADPVETSRAEVEC